MSLKRSPESPSRNSPEISVHSFRDSTHDFLIDFYRDFPGISSGIFSFSGCPWIPFRTLPWNLQLIFSGFPSDISPALCQRFQYDFFLELHPGPRGSFIDFYRNSFGDLSRSSFRDFLWGFLHVLSLNFSWFPSGFFLGPKSRFLDIIRDSFGSFLRTSFRDL